MDLFTTQNPLESLIIDGKFQHTAFDARPHADGQGIVIDVPHGRLYYTPPLF